MKCPIDGEELAMAVRAEVEIDYCPKCRGVWLDRGELDKIIERSTADVGPVRASAPESRRDDRRDYDDDDRRRYDDRRGYDDDKRPYRKRKRESFLSELFDF